VIQGYSELLLAKSADNAELADMARQIHRSSLRASVVTQQLLAFSKKQVFAPVVSSVASLMESIEPDLRKALGPDIALESSIPAAPAHIRIDPGGFGQILRNLAANSKEAMPRGGRFAIEAGTIMRPIRNGQKPVRCVRFLISDSGEGLPGDALDHLFEPYFTAKGRPNVNGLALSTVQGIVEQSGGEILVESGSGPGTRFTILFPQADAEGSRSEGARPAAAGAEAEAARRILVVEDEPSVRTIIGECLRHGGFSVAEAGDGRQALETFSGSAQGFDLILTDMIMPGMGGLELRRRIKEAKATQRILLMSGYSGTQLPEEVEGGPVDFIGKPFSPQALLEKVRSMLAAAA
jgi:two-component system, cell cycle sensor histidine kinase and response regulator CckA